MSENKTGFRLIASRIDSIDGQKAYILGLLHDYGKMVRDADNKEYFHGLTGYHEMNRLGFDDVARVCLTHTFPDKDCNNGSNPWNFPGINI